ncbi:MAG: PhzF family phenazine biosynthesis protein [Solirubrobacteraceae bacterium]
MSDSYRYVLLDVFTDTPLQGNQLAVFPEAPALSATAMQRLARELNLSETVFVRPAENGGDARIRIFTPASEMPFAGHPTLGSAVVIGFERGREQLTLETGAGAVAVVLSLDSRSVASGWMRQPIPTWEPYEHQAELLRALGVERSELPVEAYVNGPRHVYVQLADTRSVAALSPEMRALSELGETGFSCFSGSGSIWKTRVFAPGLGVAEDPATGSSAGPLAVHLARHGRVRFGEEIEIQQGSEIGRPSRLLARAIGSAREIERVEVGGSAVIVARGEFLL